MKCMVYSNTYYSIVPFMAVGSGPAGPVLAGPVLRSFLELRMRR